MNASAAAKNATVVVGETGGPGASVAEGLAALGTPVTLVVEGAPSSATAWAGPTVACDMASAQAFSEALAHAPTVAGCAALGAVIWARVPPGVGQAPALAEMDQEAWAAAAEAPITEFVHLLQGASKQLSGGGRVVLLVPSAVLSGAAGLVAWTAAAEAQRSLLRVAARCWGGRGISLACVAVPAHLLCGAQAPLERPGLPAPSLPHPPTLEGDVARVIGELGTMADVLTGVTVAVDGGVWMTP